MSLVFGFILLLSLVSLLVFVHIALPTQVPVIFLVVPTLDLVLKVLQFLVLVPILILSNLGLIFLE